jgi:hypothetical protein
MTWVRCLVRSVWDFWTRPIRPEPLALFRILLGGVILASLLCSTLPRLTQDLGSDGLVPPAGLEQWFRDTGRFSLLCGPTSIPLLDTWVSAEQAQAWASWCEKPRNVSILFAVWILALLLMTLGCYTRLATIVAWALTVSFHNRLAWLNNGGDSLFRCGLFYLLFAPAGAAWSLDARHRRRKAEQGGVELPPVLIPPWSVRLMQIQLCLVYLFTGLVKVGPDWVDLFTGHLKNGADWLNGEAVYWVLNDVAVARWPYAWLPVPLLVCRLLSWGTLVFEIGFSFLVLVRRLRPWLLLTGVLFHLGIFVHTEVGWFSQVSLCWYVLFVPAETVVRWVQKVRVAGFIPAARHTSSERRG